MPKTAEAEIARRGGAIRWRSKCVKGRLYRVAIVRDPGERGGHTVAYDTGRRCGKG